MQVKSAASELNDAHACALAGAAAQYRNGNV